MQHTESHLKSNSQAILELLKTCRFGRSLRYFDRLDSTNTEAMRWAGMGAAEGSLVVADYQTAGRGRHGRSWYAQASRNLLFSLVLRPSLSTTHWGLITVAASLAVAEIIEAFTPPLSTTIKWPNDVLLQGKKCCGMLLESALTAQTDAMAGPVVLGIGININQDTFDDAIAPHTTSLLLESGRHIPRLELMADVLYRFETYYDRLLDRDYSNLIQAYTAKMAYRGEASTLRFTGKNEVIQGIIEGISPTGALCFKTPSGIQTFHAGEVTSRWRADCRM